MKQNDLMVSTLGECRFQSPLLFAHPSESEKGHFVSDSTRLRADLEVGPEAAGSKGFSYEEAGPRERIFCNPSETTAPIVTCGGLSLGLNNVYEFVQRENW